MGTTSDKLNYLNTTKRRLRAVLNGLGEDVTDETTFRNYVTSLANIYNRLPKTQFQEGTNINLGKTFKSKLDFDEDTNGKNIIGKGNASQDNTQGYNLLPSLQDRTKTENGITFKVENGLITISGTSTAPYSSVIINLENETTLTNQDIYIYLFNTFATEKVRITFYRDDTLVSQIHYGTLNKIFRSGNLTNATINNLKIEVIEENLTLNGTTKPMLATSNIYTSWEKYTGGISAPNPPYPQPITVVTGEKIVYIKDENNNIITTKTIDFGTLEFAGIGDYKDQILYDINADKWYKERIVTKKILSGGTGEGWTYQTSGSNSIFILGENTYLREQKLTSICSHYQAQINGTFGSMSNNQCMFRYYNDTANVFYICDNRFTSLANFKTWLASNNVTLYYVVKNDLQVLQEITDENLIDQLYDIWGSKCLEGQTYIETDGMIIRARAIKGE